MTVVVRVPDVNVHVMSLDGLYTASPDKAAEATNEIGYNSLSSHCEILIGGSVKCHNDKKQFG